MSMQLPFDARLALRRAALTPVTKADPLARVKAINEAMASVRAQFPKFFKG